MVRAYMRLPVLTSVRYTARSFGTWLRSGRLTSTSALGTLVQTTSFHDLSVAVSPARTSCARYLPSDVTYTSTVSGAMGGLSRRTLSARPGATPTVVELSRLSPATASTGIVHPSEPRSRACGLTLADAASAGSFAFTVVEPPLVRSHMPSHAKTCVLATFTPGSAATSRYVPSVASYT